MLLMIKFSNWINCMCYVLYVLQVIQTADEIQLRWVYPRVIPCYEEWLFIVCRNLHICSVDL